MEKKSANQELEEILERVEEGTTTAADAQALRRLFEERHQKPAKKRKVISCPETVIP